MSAVHFERDDQNWMTSQIEEERSPRRRELLKKGLGHGTVELLRTIWHPAIGNFDHLYPEWEVRDLNNSYRYLDLAYLPGHAKGNIEIHGFKSHARDLDVTRFKDLCRKQSLLSLDDWIYLPIAYLSIWDEPELCKQLILSFIGKFIVSSESCMLRVGSCDIAHSNMRLTDSDDAIERIGGPSGN